MLLAVRDLASLACHHASSLWRFWIWVSICLIVIIFCVKVFLGLPIPRVKLNALLYEKLVELVFEPFLLAPEILLFGRSENAVLECFLDDGNVEFEASDLIV